MNRQRNTIKKLVQQGTVALLFTTALSAFACPSTPLVGSVCVTAADFCPDQGYSYLRADGQLVSIQQYQALYALLGTTFGGNATQGTFAVPDLRARTPIGLGMGPGLSNIVRGQTRGNETAQLTVSNLPPHSHSATLMPNNLAVTVPVSASTTNPQPQPDATHNSLSGSPTGTPTSAAIWTDTQGTVIANVGKVSNSAAGVPGRITMEPTGQSAPFGTVPPQVGLTYCIAAYGDWPTNPN